MYVCRLDCESFDKLLLVDMVSYVRTSKIVGERPVASEKGAVAALTWQTPTGRQKQTETNTVDNSLDVYSLQPQR